VKFIGRSIPRCIPKRRWSRPIHMSGSPRVDSYSYPNFDATMRNSIKLYIYIYTYILWISQRTRSLCISIHLWWILIKTLLNIFQPGIPVQASREGNKPCFMCLSVLGLRTSRGGRGRDPKHLQPFDRGRSPFSCGQLYRGILGFGSLAC
jgi:hypothetical protein